MPEAYIALDVGDKRIGVALSTSGVVAEPLVTLDRGMGRTKVLNAIQEVVEKHQIRTCVMGLPRLENGEEGEQAEKTRAFSRSLVRRLPKLKIEFWDERYTTGDARQHLISQGKPIPKGALDRLAAAFILQQYLDHRSQQKPAEEQK